jgi:hypothetical protein
MRFVLAIVLILISSAAWACQPLSGFRIWQTEVEQPADAPLIFTLRQYAPFDQDDPLARLTVQVSGPDGPVEGELHLASTVRLGGDQHSGEFGDAFVAWVPVEPLQAGVAYALQAQVTVTDQPRCTPEAPCIWDEQLVYTIRPTSISPFSVEPSMAVSTAHPEVCLEWMHDECAADRCVASERDLEAVQLNLELSVRSEPEDAFVHAFGYDARLAVRSAGVPIPINESFRQGPLKRLELDRARLPGNDLCAVIELTDVLGRSERFDLGCTMIPELVAEPDEPNPRDEPEDDPPEDDTPEDDTPEDDAPEDDTPEDDTPEAEAPEADVPGMPDAPEGPASMPEASNNAGCSVSQNSGPWSGFVLVAFLACRRQRMRA